MIVVILGPDGSGKSTLADILVDEINNEKVKAYHYPFRFGYFPALSYIKKFFNLSSFKEDKKISSSNISDDSINYDLRENPTLRTLIYMVYYGFEYLVGGLLLRVQNVLVKKKKIAIFARYFYDYYYQSNNRKMPLIIKKTIGFIIPRPDYTFFIERDAFDIFKNKPELPVKEIKNQQAIIKRLFSKNKNFFAVDGSRGVRATATQVLQILREGYGFES